MMPALAYELLDALWFVLAALWGVALDWWEAVVSDY